MLRAWLSRKNACERGAHGPAVCACACRALCACKVRESARCAPANSHVPCKFAPFKHARTLTQSGAQVSKCAGAQARTYAACECV
eukprot:6210591-Pleurochrysis_carterae.AAC.1